jgi:hypothetical protein
MSPALHSGQRTRSVKVSTRDFDALRMILCATRHSTTLNHSVRMNYAMFDFFDRLSNT